MSDFTQFQKISLRSEEEQQQIYLEFVVPFHQIFLLLISRLSVWPIWGYDREFAEAIYLVLDHHSTHLERCCQRMTGMYGRTFKWLHLLNRMIYWYGYLPFNGNFMTNIDFLLNPYFFSYSPVSTCNILYQFCEVFFKYKFCIR